MPYIALSATDSNNLYSGGSTVSKKPYKYSNLFNKYEHKPATYSDSGNIWVFKARDLSWSGGRHLTINVTQGSYKRARLVREDVYFNIYRQNSPLILVLHFTNRGTESDRYYKLNNIDNEIKSNSTKNVEELIEFVNEEKLLTDLLKENDNLREFLTYNINLKDDTNGTTGKSYNESSITVKKLKNAPSRENHFTNILGQITPKSYSIHRHEPKGRNKSFNSCFLYNKNLPINKDKEIITDIQDKKYNVTVYWHDKVEEPLLLEFNQGGSGTNTTNKYYYHKRDNDGSLYWEEITKETNVLGVQFDSKSEIYNQLIDNKSKNLIDILTKVRLNFQKYLYIMLDKIDLYKQETVTSSFTKSSNDWLINGNITPSDQTQVLGKCLKGTNFKMYEHDFTTSVNEIKPEEKPQLRFIIPKSEDNSYAEITLYNNKSTSEQVIETLEYNSSHKKLYVYFYGDDHRPLLVCYAGSAYRPKTKSDYFTKWIKDSKISTCSCQKNDSPPQKDTSDETLLNVLSEIVGILNEVQLHQRNNKTTENEPNKGSKNNETFTYDVHTFKKRKIQVKVTYWNMSCNRSYIHEVNVEGHRLGQITYESTGPEANGLTYTLSKHLEKVYVYYNIYDNNHQYPLLVMLKFKTGDNEYFSLKNKGKPFQWEKVSVNLNEIEDKIDEIWNKLSIEYKQDTPLFNTSACNKGNSNLGIYVGVPVGCLGGAGAVGGGGYFVYITFIATSAPV